MNLRVLRKKGISPKKSRPKKSSLEKIAKRITPVQSQEDEKGEYLNVCTYHHHPGIIGTDILEAKGCIYLNDGNPCEHYKKYRKE